MIDKISNFDDRKLSAIEENANRLLKTGNDKQRANAEIVLAAIVAERQRRKDDAADRRKQHVAEITDKVRDKGLLDRVLLAFTEIPPEQWEAEVLKEIASNPGQDGSAIARAIGKNDVGYINLAVGGLCRTRELYLGVAPELDRRKGEKTYSGLLIDFTRHQEPSGSQWFGWTLKPEAYVGLKQLGIVE
jgi:hypothetical protein